MELHGIDLPLKLLKDLEASASIRHLIQDHNTCTCHVFTWCVLNIKLLTTHSGNVLDDDPLYERLFPQIPGCFLKKKKQAQHGNVLVGSATKYFISLEHYMLL